MARCPQLLSVTAAALALGALLLLVLWPAVRRHMTYPGGRLSPSEGDPARWGLDRAREVRFVAADGVRLHGWWIPADARAIVRTGESCGGVIYFHGNADTIAPRAWLGRRLAALGLDVLLFDYRGYGLSEGRPTEEGLRRDARAAWSYMVEERGVDPGQLVLFGHSLGSAVATELALERQAAALVLGAPFPDFPGLFRHHAPWLPLGVLPWRDGRYAAGRRIAELEVPVLIAVGENDRVIPPAMSRAVYDAAPDPRRLVVTSADHATLVGQPEIWSAIGELLGARLGCGGPGPASE